MFKALTFCLAFAASTAFAQPAPVRGANVICVTTPDSARAALINFARLLQANGVAVERLDKELLSITTRLVTLPQAAYASHATFLATATPGANSIITVTGQTSTVVLNTTVNLPAAASGGERGAALTAFRLMDAAAKAYPNATLAYKKQP